MKKTGLWTFIATLAVLASGVICYFFLPPVIPLHWNIYGEIDNYGNKAFIFLLAALPLVIYLLMQLAAKVDPKRELYETQPRIYEALYTIVIALLTGVYLVSLLASFGIPLDISRIIPILIGLVFAGIGVLLPRLRPNFFAGIRTPWTLTNDEVWTRTHNAGGIVFALSGLLFLVTGLMPWKAVFMVISLVELLSGIIFLFLYSYLLYRKQNR